MAWKWLPWRAIVRRAARAYGVVDPLRVAARLRRFSQPSEVAEPLELLRAGIIFHARGLINTKAIQHNLDWVWPYWVVRQFDPADASFIPRAFSFSHVNLTHRNWTAVGLPDCGQYPIVDPRGLWTPLHDGWSIDCWVVGGDAHALLPSHCRDAGQDLELEPTLAVETRTGKRGRRLRTRASVVRADGRNWARLEVEGHGEPGDRLVVAVRPYNPEGIQFIDHLEVLPGGDGLRVNHETEVRLEPGPARFVFDTYAQGDVYHRLGRESDHDGSVSCPVGMATGAAIYPMSDERRRCVTVHVPLERSGIPAEAETWPGIQSGCAEARLPEDWFQFLFDAASATIVLHSVDDIVPGPYTYRRFWFRDACLILQALLAAGHVERARAALERFPARQKATGYFQSQEGEWDSNGQVLWAYGRFQAATGEVLPEHWLDAIERGARWIHRKRLRADAGPGIGGLLPAGFSAEHLGPNDYYYWDNWWAVAGLEAAARVLREGGRRRAADAAAQEAQGLRKAIRKSLEGIPRERGRGGMPAAPARRMDAGAVGSLVADYPLHLLPPADPWVMRTVDYLCGHSFHKGGFFQNMIHSGINAYLTLDIAQTLLRADRPHRAWPLIRTVAELASPTGQWPEAIHPATGGGCMGDGQHVWAAAEWLMIVRALFLREEEETLVIAPGIPAEWLDGGHALRFGPTPTAWGGVSVKIDPDPEAPAVRVLGDWRGEPPWIRACMPGHRAADIPADGTPVTVAPRSPSEQP